MKVFIKQGWFFAALLSVLISSNLAFSEQEIKQEERAALTTLSTPRFTLHIGSHKHSTLGKSPMIKNVANRSIGMLNDTFKELQRIFSIAPKNKVILRFLSPDEFRARTGAPAWTSAMFYRGEITIPMSPEKSVNFTELDRALRHEYTHALIAEISNYRSPAWLDEGLAQLIEGHPNPLLGPALRSWVAKNEALPLLWLQNGFTTLDNELVPAAYAQSLFATRTLLNKHGLKKIIKYLEIMGTGVPADRAFEPAFGVSMLTFEQQLTPQIRRWARSGVINP